MPRLEFDMPRDDDSYYRRRLLQEEEAIRRATSVAAVERHEELAAAYRLRLHCAELTDLPARARSPLVAAPVREEAAPESLTPNVMCVPG